MTDVATHWHYGFIHLHDMGASAGRRATRPESKAYTRSDHQQALRQIWQGAPKHGSSFAFARSRGNQHFCEHVPTSSFNLRLGTQFALIGSCASKTSVCAQQKGIED
ncbi:hypothetical protein [Rhodovulum sp. P5]|uniref:hypothetical protein n=1 Tax=Rhodovulum sp. P5 TaxID=1564506 RepID=UPI0012EC6EB7|nr:hypothetical protein [Rhodovulum sp. P5]